MIGNNQRDDSFAGQSGREAPERARRRCRGFRHTLAAECFQLRISVITFRSVIYSRPLAATHDPHSPGDLIKGGGWAVQTTLSVNSNGFTACLFSLVLARVACWCTSKRRFRLSGSRPPRLNLQQRSGPRQRQPRHHGPFTSLVNPVYLWELGTHMCCYMGHKLTTHDAKSRKNLNRKRAKENEGVGEGAAVNHVWKRLTAGGEGVHDLCIAATGRSKSWHGTRCYANPYIMKTSKIWSANDPWPLDIWLLPHMELETPSIHLEFQCSEREWYDTWNKMRSIYQWSLITYHHDILIKAIKTTLHCPSLLPSQDITLRVIFKCLICSAGPFVLNDFLMACIWKSFEEIKIQEQNSFINPLGF